MSDPTREQLEDVIDRAIFPRQGVRTTAISCQVRVAAREVLNLIALTKEAEQEEAWHQGLLAALEQPEDTWVRGDNPYRKTGA